MMHRSATQRVVESDDIEELPDSFEDDGQDLNRLHSMRGSLDMDHPMSSRHPSSIDDRSSISLTMTPTTRFLDQPVLIDMTKDAKSTTGSSQTVPGRRGSGTYHENFTASGRFRGGLGANSGDDLVQLQYETPSLLWMSIAAIIGIITGSLLNSVDVDPRLETWIGVPGDMYTRVMECVALPLIFTSVTICVAHLFISTKTQGVLKRMLLLLILAAFLASLVAMSVSFLMASSFKRKHVAPAAAAKTMISLQCANHYYVSMKTLKCDAKQLRDALPFTLVNITGMALQNTKVNDAREDVTFIAQTIDFFSIVFYENITMAFSTSQFLGIIIFSMFVGAGLIISQDYPTLAEQNNYFFLVLKQISVVLEMILNWLIRWIPLGAVSSLTNSIMTGVITQKAFEEYMFLPITLFVALAVYFLVVCLGYYILVRRNPFQFLGYLMPALVYVFASGSYVATIPVMMRSIESSRQVSRTLAQFTVSIGTAVSLCGSAAFYVVSCIYMAYTSGIEHKLTPGRVIVLMILSTITSFGAPRTGAPNLTFVATIWITTFGGGMPDSFPMLLSMEWLNVRMRRLVNVAVVAIVARIIAEQLDESAEDEEERVREYEGHDSIDNGSDIAPL